MTERSVLRVVGSFGLVQYILLLRIRDLPNRRTTTNGVDMSMRASGKFIIKSWDEKTYREIEPGGKLTKASVTQQFVGDIEGDGDVEYLMAYSGDGSASFVGFTLVAGTLGGKKGSFVLQCSGTFEAGVAKSEWFVVRGSGRGELVGLSGTGGYTATHDAVALTLEYEFAG